MPSEGIDVAEFQAAGLYDPDARDADDRLALLQLNAQYGITINEMVEADRDGRLSPEGLRRAGHLLLLEACGWRDSDGGE
jgi:hypothetical protein